MSSSRVLRNVSGSASLSSRAARPTCIAAERQASAYLLNKTTQMR